MQRQRYWIPRPIIKGVCLDPRVGGLLQQPLLRLRWLLLTERHTCIPIYFRKLSDAFGAEEVNRYSNIYLARGHVNALKAIQDNCGLAVYNLGTGKGYSVLELVEAFERVNGIKIPYVIDDRSAGDVPVVYSDPSKAERELGWRAEYGINEMVRDSWNWQKRNPNGFE